MKLVLACAAVLFAVTFASAQEGQEGPAFPPGQQPPEFDQIIKQMKFEKPTRIVGRLRSFDGYEDAIWIDWTHVHDGSKWRELSKNNEMMFKVLPRDPGMMEFFKKLKLGATLHLTVQMDAEGNRRAVALDEGT